MNDALWVRLLLERRVWLFGAVGLLAITAPIPAVILTLGRRLLQAMARGASPEAMGLLAGILGLFALHGAVFVLRTHVTKRVSWDVAHTLRRRLHRRWLEEGGDKGDGARMAALSDEVDNIQYAVSAGVTLLRNPVSLLALLAVAGWFGGWLIVPAIVGAIGVAWSAGMASSDVRRRASEARAQRSNLLQTAQEQLAAAELLRGLDAVDREATTFAELSDADRRARHRLDVARALPVAAVQMSAALSVAFVVVFGMFAIDGRSLPTADVVAFVGATLLAIRPAGGLADAWSMLLRADAGLARVESELKEAPDVAHAVVEAGAASGAAVRLDDVGLAFGSLGLFSGVELTVEVGELVWVRGATGCGKTSLLRLMDGTLVPSSGSVRVGGTPPHRLAFSERAQRVTRIPQEPVLFGRTLAENLRLGAPDASEEALWEALRAVDAHDLVSSHPEGLRRQLGRHGAPLSGGQRQRLCLARAWLTRAPLVLIDEPTSWVDDKTAERIVEGIRTAKPSRAWVVASHDARFSVLADRVLDVGVCGRTTGASCAFSSMS